MMGHILEGVYWNPIDTYFEMAVGTGGEASGTDAPYQFPFGDDLSNADAEAGHVPVKRRFAVAVVDHDSIAVSAFMAGPNYLPATSGHNSCTNGSGDIETSMHFSHARDGVDAPTELGRDAPMYR